MLLQPINGDVGEVIQMESNQCAAGYSLFFFSYFDGHLVISVRA